MKLLIITQKVDLADPILGFFHGWILAFSQKFNSITVICLGKGEYNLPGNVKVLSLGKEIKKSKAVYLWRYFFFLLKERKKYDAVLVHMNQEYVILAGWLWWFLGKKVFMWRNHHSGSWLTDLSVLFCDKVFCTSKYSYTAKYRKTVLMPVGIDLDLFKENLVGEKIPKSILFVGRISPVKKIHVLIEALKYLKNENIDFSASVYGDPLESDQGYYQELQEKVVQGGLDRQIKFYSGVPNSSTANIYNSHKIFVNLSSSGMYDKTIFESIACGCLPVVCNKNLVGQINNDFIFIEDDHRDLASKLKTMLKFAPTERDRSCLHDVVINHSLTSLSSKIFNEIR
ncbi:MAG: glycosyltransferase family 4 protein [Candidatus Vogelbacteria bacterium]|nr:glycosyltransferase family 4 protein [Candidatus Vogelbacteria bacterium]